jgi:protein gp37
MAKNSLIEWCHHTANLWWGCVEVHAGCFNCYARTLAKRWGFDIWGKDKYRREISSVWDNFKLFQKIAQEKNEIHRVFVGSMMDIFEKPMPLIDKNGKKQKHMTGDLRDKFFNEVVPNSPNLLFLMLTKRPSNINKYIPESWKTNPPKNVMFGTSPVDQKTFNTLTKQLVEVKGHRFLSVEPQLDKIDVGKLKGIDWVIQGGESGPHKRPFDLAWGRQLRDDCFRLSVPYFFKQIDKKQAIPRDLKIREFPNIKLNLTTASRHSYLK